MPTVLITGASRGIGRAAATAFAKAGYCVAINYRVSKDAAEQLAAEIAQIGGFAKAFQADVANYDECKNMVDAVTGAFGPIDVLINNAGISCDKLFTDTSPEDFQRTFDVNVKGTFNCTKAVANSMISRKKGCIINLSSMWGITGASCEVAYSASKAAIIGFTKALAKELGPSGIRVNCVAPGFIDTDMNANLSPEDVAAFAEDTPLCRVGQPGEVADAMLFLASDSARFITGEVINVSGGAVM